MTDKRMFTVILALAVLLVVGCTPVVGELEAQWSIRPFSITNTPDASMTATPTEVTPTAATTMPTATSAATSTATPTVAASATATPTETPTTVEYSNTITVENAGFEQPYTYRDMSIYVAEGWTCFYREQDADDATWEYGACEWKEATTLYENRVYEGESSQQWFSFYKTQECGIQQTITGIEPGRPVRATVVFMVWSSAYDDAEVSEAPSQVSAWIGKAEGDSVLWTSDAIDWYGELLLLRDSDIPGNATEPHYWYDEWNSMYYEFTPESNTITLFFKTTSEYAMKHTDVYVGYVYVEYVDVAEAVPTIEAVAEYVVSVGSGTSANVRSCADDTSCEVIDSVPTGTICTVSVDADGWYGVTCYPEGEEEGISGYVWGELLVRVG
jgi:hypothetical protein